MPGIGADDDVLQSRHLAEQPDVLEGSGDAEPSDLVALELGHHLVVERDGSGGRPIHPGHRIEAGGLAGTVRPDESEDLATVDGEGHRIQRGEAAELHRHLVQLDKRFTDRGFDLPCRGDDLGDHLGIGEFRHHVGDIDRHRFVEDHRADGALAEGLLRHVPVFLADLGTGTDCARIVLGFRIATHLATSASSALLRRRAATYNSRP